METLEIINPKIILVYNSFPFLKNKYQMESQTAKRKPTILHVSNQYLYNA